MQMVAVRVVEIRMVVERVHLMHPDVRELVRVRVERVDERARLAVRERNDDVGAVDDVFEHGFGGGERPRRARCGPAWHAGTDAAMC